MKRVQIKIFGLNNFRTRGPYENFARMKLRYVHNYIPYLIVHLSDHIIIMNRVFFQRKALGNHHMHLRERTSKTTATKTKYEQYK